MKGKTKITTSGFNFEKAEGPFYGSRQISPLLPSPLRHWFHTAGMSLLILLFILTAYQGARVYIFPESQLTVRRPLTPPPAAIPLRALDEFKPFLQYAEIFKKREIFKIYERPSPFVAPAAPRATLTELASSLSLSGILFGKEPQAIIEDKKTGKTYFLKKGEYLHNIKIDEIQRGKVRLRLDSETLELEL